LGRKREIEECKLLIDNSTILLNKKNILLNSITSDIKNLNEAVSSIKNEINDKNNLYNMNLSKINMLREQSEKTELAIRKYSEEMQFIKDENEGHKDNLKNIFTQTEDLKKLIEEKEKDIEQTIKQNEANKNRYDEYNKVILAKRDLVAQITQDIRLKEEKINNIRAEIQRNYESKLLKEENLKIIENEIKSADSVIEEYSSKASNLEDEIKIINENYLEEKESLDTAQNEIYEYQNKINDANKAITDILDDEIKMNVKIERENSKVEEISEKLWEDYEINYAMALKYKDDSISQTRLYNEVNTFKKAIKELGNVNLDSIQEYEEVKENKRI